MTTVMISMKPTIEELKVVAWVVAERLKSPEYDSVVELDEAALFDIICPPGTPLGVQKWLSGPSVKDIAALLVSDGFLDKNGDVWVRGYNALFPEKPVYTTDEQIQACVNLITMYLKESQWVNFFR